MPFSCRRSEGAITEPSVSAPQVVLGPHPGEHTLHWKGFAAPSAGRKRILVLGRGSLKFNCPKKKCSPRAFKLRLQSFVPQLSHLNRSGWLEMDPTWLLSCGPSLDLWCTFGPCLSSLTYVLCLRIKLYRLLWVLSTLGDCRTWVPVPVGSGTIVDAFFVELFNKPDTKSCSEIAQPPAPFSGKLSKITILIID